MLVYLCYTFLSHRCIFSPFSRPLSTKWILIIVTIIYSMAMIIQIPVLMHIVYVDGRCATCYPHGFPTKTYWTIQIIYDSLGPLFIICTTQVVMFWSVRKSAHRQSTHADANHVGELLNMSHTFVTVMITYFVCISPRAIYDLLLLHWPQLLQTPLVFWWSLVTLSDCNSMMNPLIYAKIYRILPVSYWKVNVLLISNNEEMHLNQNHLENSLRQTENITNSENEGEWNL